MREFTLSSLFYCLLQWIPSITVGDPQHFSADPDPTFHFNADPDPALYHSDAIGGLHILQGSILSLHAAIVIVHGPPWPHLSLQNS
jgi:hypothetical protein